MLGEKEKQLTKSQLTITLLLVLFISITGTTYAYFAIGADNNTLTGDMSTVNLTLDVSRIFPLESSDNTGVLVPQLSTSESATSPLANALKSGCVDSNKNVVCHVYKVNIQNVGGSATQVVNGSVSFFGNPILTTDIATVMPNLKWRLVNTVNETNASNSSLGANVDHAASSGGEYFVSDLTMVTGSSFTYYLIVWINETNDDQVIDEGNSFYGVIDIDSSNGSGVTAVFGDAKPSIDDTKYLVTFDPNGGTVSTTSKEVTIGQKYGSLPTPTREGYTFKGWNGKNMFNEEELLMAISGAEYENGYYVFTSANARASYGNGKEYPIYNFKENTRYTLSVYGYAAGSGSQNLRFTNSYTDGTSNYKNFALRTDGKFVYTSTSGKTISKITNSYNSSTTNYISHVQLEKGATATEWEPYYITTNTKVVQAKNHTLTAIWEENE